MKRLALAGIAAVLAFAAPAHAVEKRDPNDTKSKLDISLIKGAVNADGIGQLRLETYDTWGTKLLRKDKDTSLRWLFDKGGDGDVDLIGRFVHARGVLSLRLQAPRGTATYEPVEVVRPNARTVKVEFSFDIPQLSGNDLRVFAKSTDAETAGCDETGCEDRAPRRGALDLTP